MSTENNNINRLTCRFENKNLEKEYLKHSWKRSWKNIKIFLSVNVPVSLIIIADDLFVQGVGTNKYYLSFHLFSILLLFLFLFLQMIKSVNTIRHTFLYLLLDL